MERVLEQLANSKTVVAVGERQPEADLIAVGGDEFDPHIWNDPVLWMGVVEVIRDTLMEDDPDNADFYEENAAAYLAEIEATHQEMLDLVSRVPADTRLLITAHDAFGYYARTYGFEVTGLQGLSTESEASTDDVQQLANLIVERQIPAIFVETSVSATQHRSGPGCGFGPKLLGGDRRFALFGCVRGVRPSCRNISWDVAIQHRNDRKCPGP